MPLSTRARSFVIDAQRADQHPIHNGIPATSDAKRNYILKGELFSSPNQIALSILGNG